jgi:hypothetical protein
VTTDPCSAIPQVKLRGIYSKAPTLMRRRQAADRPDAASGSTAVTGHGRQKLRIGRDNWSRVSRDFRKMDVSFAIYDEKHSRNPDTFRRPLAIEDAIALRRSPLLLEGLLSTTDWSIR